MDISGMFKLFFLKHFAHFCLLMLSMFLAFRGSRRRPRSVWAKGKGPKPSLPSTKVKLEVPPKRGKTRGGKV